MSRVVLDKTAIRRTLKRWAHQPKEPEYIRLPYRMDQAWYDDTPRPPGSRGRPRLSTKRLSKKDKEKRLQWRRASCKYWLRNKDLILAKAQIIAWSNRKDYRWTKDESYKLPWARNL